MFQRLAGAVFGAVLLTPITGFADTMTREEIEEELMGVQVSGIIEGTDIRWRECIDREGHTLYEVEGRAAQTGRVTVTDAGLACFSYGGVASCFTVERDGPYYAFVDSMDRFLVQQVQRPVRQCGRAGATS